MCYSFILIVLKVKRINSKTETAFKHGDSRGDGFVFSGYNFKKIKQDGTFIEVWMSPDQQKKKKDYDKKRSQRISSENRNWMNSLKMLEGCACCGYKTHPEGLDFDHLHDKEFNIGRGGTLSKKRLEKEIKKCQVLCGTCHHIKTRNEKKFNEIMQKRGVNPSCIS
jgi:5-methylcytosine-specific restriction endonuclease McrA